MAQYREGIIHLTFGDPAVTGVGTRFLSNVRTGDMLLSGTTGPAGFVATVLSDTELLLERGWPGGDALGGDYAIHRDFDPTTGAPLLAPGDTGLPLVFNRAVGLLSAQTAVAVAGSEAVVAAQAARDAAQAAKATAIASADATAADRQAVSGDRSAVAGDRTAALAARTGAETARDAAVGSAGAVAADRAQTGTDRAAIQTALATAQSLVGSAGTGTATGLAYAALTKSLLTATDVVAVHVYDTRLDSDGGAWTERPAGSWYWEPLNTATRGATRRFPKVALLVVRATNSNPVLTIYDAHDLDANGTTRMWMAFPSSASWWGQPIGAKAVHALNGRIWIVTNTGSDGRGHEINFVSDRMERFGPVPGSSLAKGGIATRSMATLGLAGSGRIKADISSTLMNAVHARVLPGAPLDSAGLPIPTVAVATPSGVSVIHPNGAVYDISDSGGMERVIWLPDNRLMFEKTSTSTVYIGPVPYADITSALWRQSTYSGIDAFTPNLRAMGNVVATALATNTVGRSLGLELYAPDYGSPSNGMTAFVTKDYATGWQPGDIRGAWLCDAMAGGISATGNLVNNGDFSGGTAGWSVGAGASQSVTGDEMQVTGTSPYNYTQQTLNTVIGQTYMVIATVRKGTSDAARLSVFSGIDIGDRIVTATSTTNVQITFTAQSTTTYVSLTTGSTPGTAFFKNISARIGLPDRSYRERGLLVNGTLSRSALPCGLSAISGFNVSNYLQQPYNPNLDFGSGDFSVVGWINTTDTFGCIVERAENSAGNYGNSAAWRIELSNGGVTIRTSANGYASSQNLHGYLTRTVNDGFWHHFVACRRGARFEIFIDGERLSSADADATNLNNSVAELRVGLTASAGLELDAWLCLLKLTAFAPSPSQIRKMYEDERALVIGGTPATLGGTSNNVTALAVNDATGALAVGTGDGVSIFAGLSRVQYLDGTSGGAAIGNDAVTALSASGSHLLIGTSANTGLISEGVIARDRLGPAGPPSGATASDPQVVMTRGVTTDATPTDLSPRIFVGEREAVTLDVTVQARSYGATSSQGGRYRRLARYTRDAGGNVTLAGSVETIGADQETAAGMDVTLSADTAAQTVTPRVTGVAGTRMVWTARITITRISEEAVYDRAQ